MNEFYWLWTEQFIEQLNELIDNLNNNPVADNVSDEERRIRIFAEKLRDRKGFTEVTRELDNNQLRRLYARKPYELILEFCFKYNDTDAEDKYDFQSFTQLAHSLIPMPRNIPGHARRLTLKDLRNYIEKNAEKEADFDAIGAATANRTARINTIIDDINYDNRNNAEEQFTIIFNDTTDLMGLASEIARFYLCKYTYFIICNQILEYKETLDEFSKVTVDEVIRHLEQERNNPNELIPGFLKSGLKQSTNANIDNLINGAVVFDYDSERAKLIHQSLLSNFILCGGVNERVYGTPDINNFLCGNDGHYIHISQLSDKTSIFKPRYNKDRYDDYEVGNIRHQNCCDQINGLQIQDFFGYKLDYSKLYKILFGIIAKDEGDINKAFIQGLLEGWIDIDRSTLLICFASMKALLYDDQRLVNSDSLQTLYNRKRDQLNITRINQILIRIGFPGLGDNLLQPMQTDLDQIYADLFADIYDDEVDSVGINAWIGFREALNELIEDANENPNATITNNFMLFYHERTYATEYNRRLMQLGEQHEE